MEEHKYDKNFQFKIEFARKYHDSYAKTIIWIISVSLIKRLTAFGVGSYKDLLIHISQLLVFILLALLYKKSNRATVYIPYIYTVLSYYSHSVFIFSGKFDEPGNPFMVHMKKD